MQNQTVYNYQQQQSFEWRGVSHRDQHARALGAALAEVVRPDSYNLRAKPISG